MAQNSLSNFGRELPKEPCCEIVSKYVHPFDTMILIFFSLILLFNTLYFLNDSCLQELGEETVAQWVVALINLTYSE